MASMFQYLEETLISLINIIPLEIFIFFASFIEEVFAPIPSSGVLLVTGSFAAVQGLTLSALIPITILAALGKTIGAIVVYYFSDKIGEVVISKFGRFFDISHESIQKFNSKITGGKRDYFFLTIFRALPILPSSVVSVGCGLLKIPIKLFIISTFLGTIIRDSIFLYAGFKGTELLKILADKTTNLESLVEIIILTIAAISLCYLYIKHKKKISQIIKINTAEK